MAKRLAVVCLLFTGLVVLDFLYNLGAQAMAPLGGTLLPPAPGYAATLPGGGNVTEGLTSVNFASFVKGGSGWKYVTQGYGTTPYSYLYINHWHNGIDIGADYGAPIYSASNGTVLATGDQDVYCPGKAFGKFVVVNDNTNNVDILYAHLGSIAVAPGQLVTRNETSIGTVGSTGLETGPHLHFSVFETNGFSMAPAHGCGPYPEGRDTDPVPYLESF